MNGRDNFFMGRKANLAKNTLIFSIGTILPKISVFITLPIMTQYLTKEEYGTFDLIFVLLPLLLPVLTLNVKSAAFRFLIDGRNNENKIRSIISNILIFSIVVSVITLLVLFCYLPGTLTIRMLTCIYMFMSFMDTTIGLFTRGIGNNLDYSLSILMNSFFKIVFIVIFLWYFRAGLTGALTAILMGSASATLFLFFRVKIYRYINFFLLDLRELKKFISYSLPTIFNSLSWWVIGSSDRLIISSFIGVASNATYAIAHKVPSILNLAQGTFSMAWSESASLAIRDSDASAYYSSMFRIILNFMGGLLGIIICSSPILFTVLVRGDYSDAYIHMNILFLASFFNIISNFLGEIYGACKKTKRNALTSMEAAICNILVNLALIKFIGLYAASLSTLVSYILAAVLRMKDVRKMVNIKYDYRHIAFIITVMILQASLCFMRNIFLDALNIVIGITFFTVLNKKMMITLWNKSLGKIRQKLASPA